MFRQFGLTIILIVIHTCLVGFSAGLKIFTKEELSKYDGQQVLFCFVFVCYYFEFDAFNNPFF
jgi:hypothetical protein